MGLIMRIKRNSGTCDEVGSPTVPQRWGVQPRDGFRIGRCFTLAREGGRYFPVNHLMYFCPLDLTTFGPFSPK